MILNHGFILFVIIVLSAISYTVIHEIGGPLQEDTFRTSNPEEVRYMKWVEDKRTAEELSCYSEYKNFNRDLKVFYVKEPAFSKEAGDIETLTLRCDTLKFYSDYFGMTQHYDKYLYFDDEGRLRKYWTYHAENDGSSEFNELRLYYNTKGELIYMDYSSGCNCDGQSGYFIFSDNKIIEHDGSYVCWCCDEDNDSIFTMKIANIGESLPRNISWWDCSGFSDAATFLNVLRVYEYDGEFNSEFLGKERVYAKILDKMEVKGELEKDTFVLNKNGWNRDEFIVSRDNEKRIRKCIINSYFEGGVDFVTHYYDIAGNLFLLDSNCYDGLSDGNIDKKRKKEQLGLYVEDGIITGCRYYINSSFEKKDQSDYLNEKYRIINSLIGTKLNKTPYLKRDISQFINIEKLKIFINDKKDKQ